MGLEDIYPWMKHPALKVWSDAVDGKVRRKPRVKRVKKEKKNG